MSWFVHGGAAAQPMPGDYRQGQLIDRALEQAQG